MAAKFSEEAPTYKKLQSSRQGHFSPSLSQNRAWKSPFTRLLLSQPFNLVNDFSVSFAVIPCLRNVALNYSFRITEALRSIPITGTSSLLWLHPTLGNASPPFGRICPAPPHSSGLILSFFASLPKPLTFHKKACVKLLPPLCRLTCNQ